jgi:hypothetical protein
MKKLMTKRFAKWAAKQNISSESLDGALSEVIDGTYEANLGGNVYKKRIRFKGQGKSGSGRTIICYKKDDKAIFVHGFTKKRNQICQPKNSLHSRNLPKFY